MCKHSVERRAVALTNDRFHGSVTESNQNQPSRNQHRRGWTVALLLFVAVALLAALGWIGMRAVAGSM